VARQGSVPPWDDISEQEQQAWTAAATAVTGRGDVTLTEVPAQSLIVRVGDRTQVFAHSFWYVEDLGSTNGTWLNGRRIFSAQRLKKGDKIRIGRTVITVVSV